MFVTGLVDDSAFRAQEEQQQRSDDQHQNQTAAEQGSKEEVATTITSATPHSLSSGRGEIKAVGTNSFPRKEPKEVSGVESSQNLDLGGERKSSGDGSVAVEELQPTVSGGRH